MSEIDVLQTRISAALDRIGLGVDALSQPSGVTEDGRDLAAELDDEKTANAQLKERLRVLNQKHFDEIERIRAEAADSTEADDLRREVSAQAEALARLDGDLQRLRQANEQLRQSNMALREANEAGVGEPHLINKAMLAELEGLRATRAADAAEAAAILARLEPLVNGAAESGQDSPEGTA
jgi:predicted  nucleic acid-binding Zn-ribbon protein